MRKPKRLISMFDYELNQQIKQAVRMTRLLNKLIGKENSDAPIIERPGGVKPPGDELAGNEEGVTTRSAAVVVSPQQLRRLKKLRCRHGATPADAIDHLGRHWCRQCRSWQL